jgi:hypothetical protein
LIGISYSQFFYPQVRADPVGTVIENEVPIRHMAREVGGRKLLLIARAYDRPDQRSTVAERVKITLKPGPDEAYSELHMVHLLQRMREIGRRVLRKEQGQ